MEFYLIRHGIAENNENINDLERSLTKEGKKKLKKFSEFIYKFIPTPDRILTSQAQRSIKTMEILNKKWKVKKVDIYSKLNPGSSIMDYIFVIGAYLNKDLVSSNFRLCIISHEPDLSIFATSLLKNYIQYDFTNEEIYLLKKNTKWDLSLSFKKGALMIIDWNGEKSILRFYSTPSIVN